MSSYRVWLGAVCLASGCWQEDKLIDGTFTEDEWAFLRRELTLPAPAKCVDAESLAALDIENTPTTCDSLATFGQRLFFSPKIAGPVELQDPFAVPDGTLACTSCHTPDKFFIDTRAVNNVSIGSDGTTRHNALGLVNDSYKLAIVAERCAPDPDSVPLCNSVFAWAGDYPTPREVVRLASGKAAMNTNGARMSTGMRADPTLFNAYTNLFGVFPPKCDDPTTNDSCACEANESPCDTAGDVESKVGLALEAYIRRLESVNSPLDRYLAGTPDHHDATALSDQERRGLSLFIGKAMCIECHRGPLLSDLSFHNTGVPQIGERVPAIDLGATDPNLKGRRVPDPALDGNFLTAPLRNVAQTAPYMHAGQFRSLGEVIEFYRNGGVSEGFSGRKDPRIQPLDLTADEARDLEAFLQSSLTGDPVEPDLTKAPTP